MATALVGIGSNQGDRHAALTTAIAAIERLAKSASLAISRFHETTPIGGPAGQPPFLNAAVRLETPLEPLALLHELQAIENSLGRVRAERWGPRTVDLDLLLYDQATLETPELTLPHPRLSFRRFVLEPAAEVAGDLLHPTTGWTVARLLEHLNTAKPYVAVVGRTSLKRLVKSLVESVNAEPIWFPWHDYMYSDAIRQFAQTEAWGPVAEMLGKRSRMLIELAESLESATWPADGRLRVSDFWLDFFRRTHTGSEGRAVCEAIDAAVRPKLLIAWLPPIDEERELAQATPRGKDGLRKGVESVRTFVREPGHGPVLYLDTPDFDAALAEAVAAVRAMA